MFTLERPLEVNNGDLLTFEPLGTPTGRFLRFNFTNTSQVFPGLDGVGDGVNMLRVQIIGVQNFTVVMDSDGKSTATNDATGVEVDISAGIPAGWVETSCDAPVTRVELAPECKQGLAQAIAEENAKCATGQYSEKQFAAPNSLVNLSNFAANADDTIDNAIVTMADIDAFFDNFDYQAVPAATSTQGDFSIADFVGGGGTESNASFIEGYINVTGPVFIRMSNTNNWSGRVELGENCGEYQNILTHFNAPGQPATSQGAPIPLGIHRIRISSWDYDGANGNINTQFSITGTNGWTTDAVGIAGLEFSNISPNERCFLGRVCEGSEDVTEVSTGLVVDGAVLIKTSGGETTLSQQSQEDLADLINAPVDLTKTVSRTSGPNTYSANYRSLTISAFSGDVTIDGQAIPQGFNWTVGSNQNERIVDDTVVDGTDYMSTLVQ